MPDQAGTWLGTRRATGHAPQMDGFIGPGLEAIAGKGPGLAGSALRQYVCAIDVRRRLARGADLPDRMQTGPRIRPGLRSCAQGRGVLCTAQVPGRKNPVKDFVAFRSGYVLYLDTTS